MEMGSGSPVPPPDCDVFLSFRGGQSFVDFLRQSLIDAGVIVFRHEEDLILREKINRIIGGIYSAKICMPVFSRGYSSSKRCLRELTRMMELKKKIIPVFLGVKPDVVRLNEGPYIDDLKKHEERHRRSKEVERWKAALTHVSNLSGFVLRDSGLIEFCRPIVREVMRVLEVTPTSILVGMDSQVKAVLELLDIGTPDVRYVAIHGMSGVGKTTLAMVVFRQLCDQFASHCFLHSVRDKSLRYGGLLHLQKQLLVDLLLLKSGVEVDNIFSAAEGIERIQQILHHKKVLIVLDDVDCLEQIQVLAGSTNWFQSGSRIIITTRDDERVLPVDEVSCCYKMRPLDNDQALQLFSMYAFRNQSPPAYYNCLSREVVSLIGGQPLLLETIGSRLYNRPVEDWDHTIMKLKRISDMDPKDKLMISCEALAFEPRQIFLDIACFLINKEIPNAIYMWEACSYYPEIQLDVLMSLSLLWVADNKFQMHNSLRELGVKMVYEESDDPRGRTRLWIHKEALGIIEEAKGRSKVQALCLSPVERLNDLSFTRENLQPLEELRFLECPGLNIVGDLTDVFPELRWLSWHSCPSKFKATNLNLEKLVILDLSYSDIDEKWDGWRQIKIGGSLKVLNLTGCWHLKRTPNLSELKSLERLILNGCRGLTEIDSSIGTLKSLKYLGLNGCVSLQSLPENLGLLESLVKFDISNSRISELPDSVGNLKELKVLLIRNTLITKLPSTIGTLDKLEELHAEISELHGELPTEMERLSSLRILNLSDTGIRVLPSLKKLSNLEKLLVGSCDMLLELPELPTSLTTLEVRSRSVQKIPDMSQLNCLVDLMWGCSEVYCIPQFPSSLSKLILVELNPKQNSPHLSLLKNLRYLGLINCSFDDDFERLGVGDLKSLRTFEMLNCDLRELHSNHLPENLERLYLKNCGSLKTLRDLSHLKKLKRLQIDNCKSLSVILGLVELESLPRVTITHCPSLEKLIGNKVEHPALTYETLRYKCEVVIGFTDHQEIAEQLHKHIIDVGVHVFRADEKFHESGDKEKENFQFQAIKSSKICIPVFSKCFASNVWCLRELVHMVDCRRTVDGLQIVPIFYDVEPSDVKLQTELYNNAMREHQENFAHETVQRWEETLREVAEIKGWELKATEFTKYSKLIAHGILNKLKVKHQSAHSVPMENQVQDLIRMIDVGSGGVSFVVIHGIGGIGKTTLAKVVFNCLFPHFQGCSYLSDIRETSRRKGLKYLQDQLLRDIHGTENVNENGTKTMKDQFLNMDVLIVLDDVDEKGQIKKLAGNSSWFGSGSRIIITTRDKPIMAIDTSTMKFPGGFKSFEMREMERNVACVLLCRHAFGNDSPLEDYRDICEEVVAATGEIPLALEIIGSLLNRKPKEVWEDTVEKLNKVPHQDIRKKLMVSYEALEHETQQIFLDIACFFHDREKTMPFYMWDACGFLPDQAIEILIFMSLVNIVDGNKLWMHDCVRDFGRQLVQQANFMDPTKRSRLWTHEEILKILWRKKESVKETVREEGMVEALSLCLCSEDFLWDITFTHKELECLPKLRLLELCGFQFAGNLEISSLSNLRWFSWHFFPSNIEATYLHLESLVILDFSRSDIDNQWAGWIQIGNAKGLKVLNLTCCKNLTITPDLTGYVALETLILEDCTHLEKLDSSIGKLKKLKYLNLKGCKSLKGLPHELCSANALEEIVVTGEGQSFEVPILIGDLTYLTRLVIADVGTTKLPSSIGKLISLVELDLSGANIVELPDSFGSMMKLKVIKMDSSSVRLLPSSLWELEKLEELHARNCQDLKGEISTKIQNLSSLKTLDLSFTGISFSPSTTLGKLYHLQTLHLESCNQLQELPELPQCLISLRVTSRKLCRVPVLSEMKGITHLQLARTSGKISVDLDWIWELKQLETLELCFPSITSLDFGSLEQLRLLSLSCRDVRCFPQLPLSLSRLFLAHVNMKAIMPNFCSLKKLTYLELYNCSSVDGDDNFAELDSLEHLSAHKHKFSIGLPKKLRVLCASECEFPGQVLDLSGLKHVIRLEITDCEQLSHIQGLADLESLEEVMICDCDSLERVHDLSNLKTLETLKIDSCGKLREVQGLDSIMDSLKQFEIFQCELLESLLNLEYKKRKCRT